MIDRNSAQARQIPVVSPTPPQTSSITITSPNSAETWQRGTSHTISWSYAGSPGSTVKISLVKAGTEIGTIISSTSIGSGGTGSYTWTINPSATLVTGSDFKVSVQSISQVHVTNTSNDYFTIMPATTPKVSSKIGIFRPSSGTWSLDSDGNNKWDVSDKSLSWGLPGTYRL